MKRQDRSKLTEAALLDAATDLIAERGVFGWTLRDVGRLAGQSNNSVVQYHFGGMTALLAAVVDRAVRAVLAGSPAEAVEVRCVAQFLASDLWSMVLEHPEVVEHVGRVGTVGQRNWALDLLATFLPAVAS